MQENYKLSILGTEDINSDDLEPFNELQKKLHPNSYKPVKFAQQIQYLRNPNLRVVVARADVGVLKGLIVGMGTVSLLPRFRTLECQIHDIVVSDDHEGQGLATSITKMLIDIAFSNFNADSITLTSRPSREGAIHIYEKLGFEKKANPTNTFVLKRVT
jgi:ribosomal protein S18 acetylase RimI-like enzyme